MRKFYLILLSLCAVCTLMAQNNVAGYTYWFNAESDQAITQSISSTQNVNLNLEIDARSLSSGLHQLNILVFDNQGKYSPPVSSFFFKGKTSTNKDNQIIGYRYWFDNEISFKEIELTPNADNYFFASIDMSKLKKGIHLLHMQTIDNRGLFSPTISRFVVGSQSKTIQKIAYWFNDEIDNLTTQLVSEANTVEFKSSLETGHLKNGINIFHMYAIDDRGQTSITVSKFFYKQNGSTGAANQIESLMYWFDDNIDSIQEVRVNANEKLEFVELMDLNSLSRGLHRVNCYTVDTRGMISTPISSFIFKNGDTTSMFPDNLIIAYEYWLDDNFENRTSIELNTPLNPMNLNIQPDFKDISQENHVFNFRTMDSRGMWSIVSSDIFYRDSIKMIGAERTEICDKTILQFSNLLAELNYKFEWNFGDGAISESALPEHYFAKAGEYLVQLKATNLSTSIDTIFRMMVKVNPSFEMIMNKNIQVGSVFEWRGKVYQEEGTYFDSFISSTGCDSVYVLNLSMSDSLYSYPKDMLLSGNTIPENAGIGYLIGSVSTIDNDPDEKFTYLIINTDTVNKPFYLEGDKLFSNKVFNFEDLNDLKVLIQVSDQFGYTLQKEFNIFVSNVNEQPYELTLSDTLISESAAKNEIIGRFEVLDPDIGDQIKFSLVAGTNDNAAFVLDGNKLLNKVLFNYEVKSSYVIQVEASDLGGLKLKRTFTIRITDENEVPGELTLSGYKIAENKPSMEYIGKFSASDPDGDALTYSFALGEGDEDNLSFIISNDSLYSADSYDYELKNIYFIRVKASDEGGLSYSRSFTIQITDIQDNTSIWNISLSPNSIEENLKEGAVIGNLSTEGGFGMERNFRFVIGDGDLDNSRFIIRGDTLVANEIFNFEKRSIYFTRIEATDESGLGMSKLMFVLINDINENPYAMYMNNSEVFEMQAIGTYVSDLITFDEDLDEQHIYSLAEGDGDTDNSYFMVRNDSLLTAAVLRYRDKTQYSIRLRTTDKEGASYSMKTIIHLNELVGTEDHSSDQINAWFNRDNLIIKAPGKTGSRIELYDIAGHKLLDEILYESSGSYHIGQISQGVYILQLIENGEVVWQRAMQKR